MSDEYYEEGSDDSIEESPENLLEDDEVSPEEEAFMKGYDDAYEEEIDEEEIDKEFE